MNQNPVFIKLTNHHDHSDELIPTHRITRAYEYKKGATICLGSETLDVVESVELILIKINEANRAT